MTALTSWLVGAYLLLVLGVTLLLRVTPSVDVFIVLVAIFAVLAGRGVSFVRDWAPFVLVFLAWEAMRGVANQFGQAVQSDSVIAIERLFMLGAMPPQDLQAALRTQGEINGLDVGLSVVYMSHFFFPLALAFWLWWRERAQYYRFVITLMAVSFAAFFTFLVLPVAPPRFAWVFGSDIVVADVMHEVTTSIGWQGFSWMYGNLVGNPFAAFPSMHAAYPVLALLFLLERSRMAALIWLPFVGLIWFATVYLGHHYVVDLLGGAAYAVVGYLAIRSSTVSRLAAAYRRAFGRAVGDMRRLLRRSSPVTESESDSRRS